MTPEFPVIHCALCEATYEVPRKWWATKYGRQILIDWDAAQRLTDDHLKSHGADLAQELEEFLNA